MSRFTRRETAFSSFTPLKIMFYVIQIGAHVITLSDHRYQNEKILFLPFYFIYLLCHNLLTLL